MPAIPLALKLKRRTHRDLAGAQDIMVLGTFEAFPAAVLHGGTAIWRCYGGNRFSEDVDFYLPPSAKGKTGALAEILGRRGLATAKLKETSNSVFGEFGAGASAVRFEATFQGAREPVVIRYEMLDGSFAAVRTLTAEALLVEKSLAYMSRRKARDLYDVYFLVHLAQAGGTAKQAARNLLDSFKPPVDEGTLRTVILTGSVPTVADMKEEILRWAG